MEQYLFIKAKPLNSNNEIMINSIRRISIYLRNCCKKNKPFTAVFTILPIFIFVFTNSCYESHSSERDSYQPLENTYSVKAPKIPENLTFAGEKVPVSNFDVRESLDREMLVNTFWHSSTFLSVKRANKYFPVIEPILKKHNIPDDFKYIAVAESGLSNATSPAGAKGVWQFMKSTALQYNLEVTSNVDERYHLEKSTEAACKYFKAAYKRFKNWTLVAAAFNTGSKRISESLESQNVKSYYDLLLNSETARYVYRVIALKLILEDPRKYGFYCDKEDLYHPALVKELKIDTAISNFVSFAGEHSTNYKVLKLLNPWLRDKSLPNKDKKQYVIVVPKDVRETIESEKE